MKDNRRRMNLEKPISVWATSIYLLLIVLKVLFGDYDFQLTDAENFYISKATIDGISVGKRVSLFYSLCGSIILLLPALFFISNWFLNRFKSSRTGITYFSVAGILLVLSDLMLYESEMSIRVVSILLLFNVGIYAFGIFRPLKNAWPALILIAVLLTADTLFLFNSSPDVLAHVDAVFLFSLILITSAYYLLVTKMRVYPRRLFSLLWPLTLSPIILFLVVESHFLFKDFISEFPYKWVFVGLIFFGFVANFFLPKNDKRNSKYFIERYYAPAALLAFLVLIFYQPIVTQPNEMFELANPANAQMRIFQFGEIPFIDFLTSHMMSEQFYGIIYHLFYGFDGSLDFLVFSFFYHLIFYLLTFYFLKRVFKNWVPAVLITMVLPYFDLVFSIHMFFSLLALLACLNAVKSPSVKSYLLLIFTLIVLVLWRLDTGVAALTSTLFFLPILFFVERKNPLWRPVLKSLGIAIPLLSLIVLVAILIRSPEYIFENFKVALHYVKGSQAHGYSTVTREWNHQFYIIHFMLPILAFIAIFYAVKKLRWAGIGEDNFLLKSSVFFFAIFLSNFPRGIVRHGFMENSDFFLVSSFYLALTLLAISFFKEAKPIVKYTVFCVVSFTSVLGIKYFPLSDGISPVEKFFTDQGVKDFDSKLKTYKGRVAGSEPYAAGNYEELRTFLNANLEESQTFLDFSNSPMLYFFCGRKVPSYFAQSLQNSIDDFAQMNHLSRLDTSRIPVVVFSHDPPNWFDATDGVQNGMRYYLIAEYIYTYYRPSKTLNGYSIWELKSKTRPVEFSSMNPLITPYYDYGHAAGLIANHFERESGSVREISTLNLRGGGVNLPQKLVGASSLFLSLATTEGSSSGDIQVSLVNGSNGVGTMKFFCKEGQHKYMLPLTNYFSWFELSPDKLKFDTSEGVELNSISIHKDLRGAH